MSFQKKLLAWFDKNQRPLPWRKHYRPYEVWVSEIMLQQTQMDTAVPYFERWMKALPTIGKLAASDEKKVLKLWEGLGYYSRARNLHASAKHIVARHGGKFPETDEHIRALKGVGPYTAGAIASIAFNRERPIVDGNVMRVLSRVYAIDKPIDVPSNREIFWKLQESLIPKGQARHFNQALMELGALVCSPRDPLCGACPAASACEARRMGRQEDFPVRNKRRASVKVKATALVLSDKDRYFIRCRPKGQIMGGLWEFPEWKGENALKEARREFGALKNVRKLGTVKRNYTHHLETMEVFAAEPTDVRGNGWPSAWAAKKDFKKFPFSSAHAKIAALIS